MGRIGRMLFKRLLEHPDIEIVAVNDVIPKENLFYLLKYDSVYGASDVPVSLDQHSLIADKRRILICQEPDLSKLPWKEQQIDVVLECTGQFKTRRSLQAHLDAGGKKVLLSTTGAEDVPLKIYGFNQNGNIAELNMLSPGGCMTNCSVHILYLLNSVGIHNVMIDIIHSYTSRQSLVDAAHTPFRRGRAAAASIIPVEIDLYQSLERLFPRLKGQIQTSSTRVPVANGAMASFYVKMSTEVQAATINKMFKSSADAEYQGIMGYTEDPIVSSDIRGNTHSCIVDATQTVAMGNQLKIVAWFDNEYGFTGRMIDWLEYWQKQL